MIEGPARFGLAVIEPTSTGTFEFGESGELAVIVPIVPLPAPDDDLVDLVAWRPSDARKWWLRRGVGSLLNPGAVLHAEITREPLPVYSTPLQWLRAAGQGIVILDWSANLQLYLGGVERIVPDSRALGEAIDRRLRAPAPTMPKIQRRAA
jgi:hypothetical protein